MKGCRFPFTFVSSMSFSTTGTEKKPVLLELLAKAVLTIENSLTTLQRFAQEISGGGEKKYDINDRRAGVSANPCVCVGIHHKANGRQGIEKRE